MLTATPRTPFGVPLQRHKAAQKQCADNHLRPKGARIENPLYLAIISRLPFLALALSSTPNLHSELTARHRTKHDTILATDQQPICAQHAILVQRKRLRGCR
jgi:hypothetical protein